jgi:hypothetical protein
MMRRRKITGKQKTRMQLADISRAEMLASYGYYQFS